eukprot:SM000117S25527  [mRNA]  locus=s117:436050:440282:+ [translate_table: standard]
MELTEAAPHSWWGTRWQLLAAVDAHRDRLSTVSTCTAFHRVARHARADGASGGVGSGDGGGVSAALQSHPTVRWLAARLEAELPLCGTQALANVAWAHSNAHHGSADLMAKVAVAAARQAEAFRPLEVAILLHAFAKANHRCPELLATLRHRRILGRLPEFTVRQVMEVAWAHAKLGEPDDALFLELAEHVAMRVGEFDSHCLSSLAWAFAKAGRCDWPLFEAIAQQAVAHIGSCSPQDVSLLAWALLLWWQVLRKDPVLVSNLRSAGCALRFCYRGQLHGGGPEHGQRQPATTRAALLSGALSCSCKAGSRHHARISGTALSNTVWAFATVGVADEPLLEALAAESLRKLPTFETQALANTAWAFATLRWSKPDLLDAIAARCEGLLEQFHDHSLSSLAFALATLAHPAPRLYAAISNEVGKRLARGGLGKRAMVVIAWSLVTQGELSPLVFPSLRPQIELALSVEAPGIGERSPAQVREDAYFYGLWLSGYIKQQAKTCWDLANQLGKRQVSGFQASVSQALTRLGVKHHTEYQDGDYSIDMAVLPAPGQRGAAGIAIEADGPSHFAANEEKRPLGPTLLKTRLLQRLGWLVIPYYEWEALCNDAEREAYLSARVCCHLPQLVTAQDMPAEATDVSVCESRSLSVAAGQMLPRLEELAAAGLEDRKGKPRGRLKLLRDAAIQRGLAGRFVGKERQAE